MLKVDYLYFYRDKIFEIPKDNKELYLGGTLMKYIKNYTKPILFFTIGILLFSLIQSGSLTSMMYKIQANLLQGLNLVKITEEKSEINDEELTIRFKVPSIHYEDKQVERNINNYIRRNIKEYRRAD